MLAGISNKIKMSIHHPLKNIELATHPDFKNFVFLLTEQILPQWCRSNMKDPEAINKMHNLFFLLAQKVHQVF